MAFQGLDLIDAGASFDLVITDIWMPGSSGTDVIREGRKQLPLTPILAITGGDPSSHIPHNTAGNEKFGANDILLKPFEREVLLEAVARLVGTKAP